MFRRRTILLLAFVLLFAPGCTGRNPFMTRRAATTGASDAVELSDFRRRNEELQSQNNALEKERANLEQELALIKQQLRDTATSLKDIQTKGDQARRQLDSLRASTRFRGGATITANNSLRQPLRDLGLNNIEVVQDKGVLRVRLPYGQLFEEGTIKLKSSAYRTLDEVTTAIGKNYPRATIAIEGHSERFDASVTQAPDPVQFSIALAKAAFEAIQRSRRSGLQSNRLIVLGMGDNYSLTDRTNGESRRVELVVYPK